MLDVGGGSGIYAELLAERGYTVTLVEPVSLHLERARARAGLPPRFEVVLGDARDLPSADEAFDSVLLLDPLYHLGERQDRVRAFAEAFRVCRPGGLVVAAAIARYAPLLDMTRRGRLAESGVAANVRSEVTSGRRVPRERRRSPFPDAYFHRPDELEAEVHEAGLVAEGVYGIEGPGWLVDDDLLSRQLDDPSYLDEILADARTVETSLSAISAHLLTARRPVHDEQK